MKESTASSGGSLQVTATGSRASSDAAAASAASNSIASDSAAPVVGTRPIGYRDHLFGALLASLYVVILMGTSLDLAMSRDESFYVVAADSYGAWFEMLFEDPTAATERAAIDRYWEYNHEHPALVKSLFAIAGIAQRKWEVFPTPGMAYRFFGMVFGGLTLWLTYIFGARAFGRQAGAFAALALALVPRFFYHAHLDCFDVPIVLMQTLVIYCYWRSLRSKRWAIITGLAYGLALATKHNSWLLPGLFSIHFLWLTITELAARRRGEAKRISILPYWLPSMLILGPPIFVASWPWLWNDGWERFLWYANFHLNHEYYNMAYFGRNYFQPPLPISFPWVMTAYTVPLVTLVLVVLGLGRRLPAILPRRVAKVFGITAPSARDGMATDVLLLGSALMPLVVISLPSTPIFGGTKHWMPAYPFMMIFAGVAVVRVTAALREVWPGLLRASRWRDPLVSSGVVATLLLPSLVETVHSHPFALAHYTYLAGGVPGAADDGMNRQFWGYTQGALADFFRDEMPQGGTVWICDTTHKAWQMMQADGMIPDNIRATGNMAAADFVIVHHEHHFAEVDFQAWVAFGRLQPAYVLTYDGVPIITVYENPRRR